MQYVRNHLKDNRYGYFGKIIVKQQSLPNIDQIRRITSSQLQTSLRPFFFLCHPDLFMKHPEQRAINEHSLQILSAHIEQLKRGYHAAVQPSLPFYLRDTKDKSNPIRLITVPLNLDRDTKNFVLSVLKKCELDTTYVQSIPDSPKKSANYYQQQPQQSSRNVNVKYKVDDNESPFSEEYDLFQFKVRKAKEDETLEKFIKKNLDLATIRTMALEALREEVHKLKNDLEKKLELTEIQYSCGWNYEHFRGCLKSLEKLFEFYPNELDHLKGKTLIFSQFTGVSLEGDIHLFTGDVQTTWRNLFKNIPEQEEYLSKIPNYENTLSNVLRNIKISRRKFMPKERAQTYTSHLSKVITNLLDYLQKNKFPTTWPDNGLANYELVVESEAGPLMLSPTGQLITPSSCPGFLLVDFITRHLDEATVRQEAYNRHKYIERDYHKKCIEELGFSTLLKDDNITPELMIECMERLLKSGLKFNNLNFHVTNYYSVLSDGTICIPWNFKTN